MKIINKLKKKNVIINKLNKITQQLLKLKQNLLLELKKNKLLEFELKKLLKFNKVNKINNQLNIINDKYNKINNKINKINNKLNQLNNKKNKIINKLLLPRRKKKNLIRRKKTDFDLELCKNKSLENYITDIEKISLLTHSEEIELAKKIQQGDKEAFNQLVKSNLRLVVNLSKQFPNKGLNLGDIINEGNLGLIKAAKRFDPKKGFKFISYAVWWCRQAIMQAIAEYSRMVRLPMNICTMINKEIKKKNENKSKLELIEKKDEDKKKSVENAVTVKYVSLDAQIGEDSNLYEIMRSSESTEKKLMNESLKTDIFNLINTLPEREREIIVKSFGLDGNPPKTLEEIGKKYNLTRERVRQIKEEVCKKLIEKSNILKDYL
jgi:RNA polymerase primary sigma factor